MKKVKFSNKNKVLDFYKDKPTIEISNYLNHKKNKKKIKKIIDTNKHKSYLLENKKIKKIINISSFTSILVLSGLLITYIHKKK